MRVKIFVLRNFLLACDIFFVVGFFLFAFLLLLISIPFCFALHCNIINTFSIKPKKN